MNIALVGYGKMGKAIEEIAVQKGHNIVLRVNDENLEDLTKTNLLLADVAIEFTMPGSAIENILLCFSSGVPVVCGTTGWLDKLSFVEEQCQKMNGTFLTTTNFSIGVNILFEVNRKLAILMDLHKEYSVEIEETHHTQKKDAPSGTAITLAKGIIENSSSKNKWVLQENGNKSGEGSNEIPINSKRIDPAAGTHQIKYSSAIDDIEIIHTAHNRKGFAAGALLAAEFIHNKKGIFTMKDVLQF